MTATARPRPQGSRPLPQPPISNTCNKEAAWYEHEERMRPSYILQPHVSPFAHYNADYNQQQQQPYNDDLGHSPSLYSNPPFTAAAAAHTTNDPFVANSSSRFPNPHCNDNILNLTPSRFAGARIDDQGQRSTVKGSAFLHKGFWDIISLANQQPSPPRLALPTPSHNPRGFKATFSKATGGFRKTADEALQVGPEYTAASHRSPNNMDANPYSANPNAMAPQPQSTPSPLPLSSAIAGLFSGQAVMGPKAQKKRISVDMVSAPTPDSFVHAAHASDAQQAEEILLRWGREGMGKVADPRWVEPIKQALRVQAARNQAQAVAQVQAARNHDDSLIHQQHRQLHIVNGAPSLVSTLTTTTAVTAVTVGHGNHSQLSTSTYQSATATPTITAGATPVMPYGETNLPFEPTTAIATAPPAEDDVAQPPSSVNYRFYQPAPSPDAQRDSIPNINKMPTSIDGLPTNVPGGIHAIFQPAVVSFQRPTSVVMMDSLKSIESAGLSELVAETRPFRPNLETVEKCVAAKIFFENLYFGILKKPKARDSRRAGLENELAELRISEAAKEQIRQAWIANETQYLRDVRARVNVNSFLKLKTIGHGAFGVVALVKERGTGQLFAMKQLRKADMLRKGQEGHVRAERDLMTSASASASAKWIVKLMYSFQDVDHLYLIMEFMGGGDLLNLLIEKDIFQEDFAKFYVAEMVLAIHEAHSLGYIHRDIKPDNFLFGSDGHIKLADFGLCQSFHWAHDGAYYDQQRKNLLKKHGIDLEDSYSASGIRRNQQGGMGDHGRVSGYPHNNNNNKKKETGLNESELNDIMSDRNPDGTPLTHVLTYREKNKKKIAYSIVGTNNYMAPEVVRGLGYDQSCDWWSLGVIVFEMIFGYPPFVSKTRHLTRQKIINWKQTLRFPPKPKVSREVYDFISLLICEKQDRLGSLTTVSVSRPNSLLQSSRRSGFTPITMTTTMGLQDGVEEIQKHSWFKGIDWKTIHTTKTPPFLPNLSFPSDTKHFEQDIDDQPLLTPGVAIDQLARDPMLRDKVQGNKLLQMRKQLAFVGYTFKSPKSFDPRTQLLEQEEPIESIPSNSTSQQQQQQRGTRLRSMSM